MAADINILPGMTGADAKKANTLGIVLRQSPYGASLAQEALEVVLAFGVYGVKVNLVFMDDGVFQIVRGQDTQQCYRKNLAKQMAGLDLYDIDQVFVCQASLSQRKLTIDQLILRAQALDAEELSGLLHSQDQLLCF